MSIYRKKCVVCETIFETYSYNKKTCSTECDTIKKKNYKRDWERDRQGNENIKTCIICSKPFNPRHLKTNTCSPECRNKKLKAIGKKYDDGKKIIHKKKCLYCGKRYETGVTNSFACSKQCYLSVHTKSHGEYAVVDAICPGCGRRHPKKILKISVQSITPRYYCSEYPGCMTTDSNYYFRDFESSWATSNSALI